MTNTVFQGYEKVTIKKLVLTSLTSRKGIDIQPIAGNIELFMSIFSPVSTGTIRIYDATGSVYTLPIIGEEIIEIAFQSGERREFNRVFHVYGVENQEYNDNGAVVSFTIKIASLDHYKALALSIYKGARKNISDFVTDILRTDLNTGNQIDVEETNGIERIIIPGWNAWESIEYLRHRAVSKEYVSPYLFFEDQDGYHFITYEKLIETRKALANELQFINESYRPEAGEDRNQTTILPNTQFRNVTQFEVISRANPITRLTESGLSSQVQMYDPFTRTLKVNTYNYNDLGNIIRQPLGDRFNPEQTTGFANTMASPSISTLVAVNMDDQNYLSQEALGAKELFASALKSTIIGFNTYGDSQLQPGDIFKFFGPPRTENPEHDRQITGNYIIGDLKHAIADGAMYTTIEGYKFGYDEAILPAEQTSNSAVETLEAIPNANIQPLQTLNITLNPIREENDILGLNISNLTEDITSLRNNVNQISSNINRNVESIRSRITGVITNVNTIRSSIETRYNMIQSRISEIKNIADQIKNGTISLQTVRNIAGVLPFQSDLLTRATNIEMIINNLQNINITNINDLPAIFNNIENTLGIIQNTSGPFTQQITQINERITTLHTQTEQYRTLVQTVQQEHQSIKNIIDRFGNE